MAELELVWWGHACFEIRCCEKSLLIDPHDGGSLGPGFKPPAASPDYVLITHEHYDHNAVEAVAREDTIVVREREGRFRLGPFDVTGVRIPHDEFDGRLRGHVVAYRVELEKLSITHLSDSGRPPKDKEVELLSADIVLIPTGDVYTMSQSKALEAANVLGARIVLPMHYWLPGMQLPLDPLETLLHYAKKWRIVRLESNSMRITKDQLPEERSIVILKPPK